MTEAELIEGCRKGKPQFQEALYRQYSSRMMGICVRYAYTSFEAEDIFQEAFVKVFKYLDSYKGVGSFEGWMKHIFVNTAINHYHKNKKHYYHAEEDEGSTVQSNNEDALGHLSTAELLKLINRLPEGYRLIFNLNVIEGYTHKEIAEMLDINEGTSKSQLAKAKAYLKRLLNHYHISEHVER